MAGADLLVLQTWLMHARGEEWIRCTHEQESIRRLLKHNSKWSFIPLVCAKPALPTWNRGGLLQKHTPAAPECTNPLLAWQEAKHPVHQGLLAAECSWTQQERAGEQWTKVLIQSWALFNTEVPPQQRSVTPGTWSHKFPYPDRKCVLMFKGEWGSRNWGVETATLGYVCRQTNPKVHSQSKSYI